MEKHVVEECLSEPVSQRLQAVHVHAEIDSTNQEAFRLLEAKTAGNHLILADAQTAGRGRRGRTWQSPAGGGLYMSLLYHFSADSAQLQGLSLVTALSVHSVLSSLSSMEIKLKWPNDLLVGNKKLSGILLESRIGDSTLPIVIGIGINYALAEDVKAEIDRPVVALNELNHSPPGREELAAAICSQLIKNIDRYCAAGFAPFQSNWNANDRYLEADVVIDSGNNRLIGKSLGVDAEGALILQTAAGEQLISGGEIFPSLREANGV